MGRTDNFEWADLDPYRIPDVPHDVNRLAREIDADLAAVAKTATSAAASLAGRLRAVEALGGLAPGDVSDATLAGVLGNPAALAVAELNRQFVRLGSQFFNVTDPAFGAVPDLAIDNTAAIQAALDAAAGRAPVLIPAGDYGCNELIFPANTIIFGYGATLHRTMTGGMGRNWPTGDTTTGGYDGRGNIAIMGLTFHHHGDAIEGNGNTITFDHAANILIRDVSILAARGYHFLELNAVNGALVENCRFAGYVPHADLNDREAIQIDVAWPGDSGLADGTMSKNILIDNCRFEPLGELPAPQVAIGSHTQAPGQLYENIVVRNCTGTAPTLRFINADWWGAGCIIERCTVDGELVSAQGIRARYSDGIEIVGNTVKNIVTQGILSSNGSIGTRMTGNTAVNCNEGLYDSDTNKATIIANNIVRDSRSYAIVANSSFDALIATNQIYGAGTAGGALGAIRLTGSATRAGITGNKVRPHGIVGVTEAAAAVSVAGTAVDAWVFGNDFKGMTAAITGAANTTSNRI